MCGKEGYWSIKYTQEEYNRSKKRFNSRINQFILDYKGEEVEEFLNKLIEALIINFNFKLTIFTDLYQKANIPKQEFSQAYSTILRGLALNHYYTNLKSNPFSVSFNKLYKATYNYFKGPEYKRDILT